MKRTPGNFDKDAAGWTLSWQPEGRCERFNREAILTYAPSASGVYGLFNFDCQIFIGESANIQEILLRLESEPDFHSQHLRPTGFTFEPCAPELRMLKAAELIARFHPVLQTEAASSENGSQPDGALLSEMSVGPQELECESDDQEFPVHEREKHPRSRRLLYFKWTRGPMLASILVASAVVVFYLGALAIKNIQQGANAAGGEPLGQSSTAQTSASVRAVRQPPHATHTTNQSAAPTRVKSEIRESAAASNGAARLAAKSASAEEGVGIQPLLEPAKPRPIADHREGGDSSKKWSVQISAAPAKDIAATLVQRLKANGYDGYAVQAEVKGQTYYRVRVGRFATRAEAESVRESLAREESYRDAYLTGD